MASMLRGKTNRFQVVNRLTKPHQQLNKQDRTMKRVTQGGLKTRASATGKIATPVQAFSILAAAATLLLPVSRAVGGELDLTAQDSGSIPGDEAIFARIDSHPTGTGVFEPFLTIQSPGNNPIEEGYNTSAFLPLDDLRNHWNTDLHLNQLAEVTIEGKTYYAFELDSNETGQGNDNKYLSIDNIRIYTSPTDTAKSAGNNPDALGELRYSLNDPRLLSGNTFNIANWVKIDSSRNFSSTSGSGSSDLIVYVPTELFKDAGAGDFVYFYNLNGVHYAADPGTGADAGFEEWRALRGVPDGGNSLVLLGSALTALGLFAGRRGKIAGNA
jgi:hypothetical protein